MNKFSKMIYDTMSKHYVPIMPTKGWMQSPNRLWNDIRSNWDTQITAKALRGLEANGGVNKLAMEYADALYAARNSVIDNIAGQFINKDKIIKGLTIKHLGDHLKNLARNAAITGVIEGLEEGQQ